MQAQNEAGSAAQAQNEAGSAAQAENEAGSIAIAQEEVGFSAYIEEDAEEDKRQQQHAGRLQNKKRLKVAKTSKQEPAARLREPTRNPFAKVADP